MRRKAERSEDTKPSGIGVQDSPAIQNLIEQLNRDLEQTRQSDSKVK
jgi:hypothetical protein